MSAESILVTGGSGFVGGGLLRYLARTGQYSSVAALRSKPTDLPPSVRTFEFKSLTPDLNWRAALIDIDVVVHAAARVHVMNEESADPLAAFRLVNVEATLNLARQAADAGVKRFIFISSIKVNGEGTALGVAFTADDLPAPADPYGVSKFEAEAALRALAESVSMEVVIIRPVLVYGPGVKANFLSMIRWLQRSIPLPLGAVDNKRSLVSLDNLIDLVVTCFDHPEAANQTFLVSDGEDVSTTQLLCKIGRALGQRVFLIPVPVGLMSFVARLVGKGAIAQRLFGSLQVDIEKNKRLLGWTPPVTLDRGLSAAVQPFLESRKR
ncbi:NAD-dependent epimerase/dehydratase family protein [Pseudomonas nunensis]|uniref:NAD-dependent epimerase/dehydratase family protein n=1 Tax=Pseudomonas nunensis TaxID=2961896 RepID=UPI0006B48749|nr:NAD-dependent epimerase/dehydratase family protein [Pseudomonas nunensis]KOY00102.1 NAD-dependent dehydratase [Pseudomonas nunensis]